MKKFQDIYKDKIEEHNALHESKVLTDFRNVYGAMLEHYGLKTVHELDEESKTSFLTELNAYWSEEEGINERGENFLLKRSMSLNENATATQKKNFLREKTYAVINETFRQANLKYRLYEVVDEVYNQVKASDLSDVLSPDMITSIISESFVKCINEFNEKVNKELKESVKPKRKYFIKIQK